MFGDLSGMKEQQEKLQAKLRGIEYFYKTRFD